MESIWEDLDNMTLRMKVPGGWLVMCTTHNGKCMAFVQDINYNWKP